MAATLKLLEGLISEVRVAGEYGAPASRSNMLTDAPAAQGEPMEKGQQKRQQPQREQGKPAAVALAAEPVAPPDPEVERKLQVLLSVGEECVTERELRNLLTKKPNFVLYDGFEPSGRMHIAQGVFKAMNVNKCTSVGGTFIFWVADWFALMNDKMGGDIDKIRTVGKYLIQVWRAAGMDMDRVRFLWSSEEISKHAECYWTLALDISRRFSVARINKCCQIMGRKEGTLTAAQILYPIMQCTDIFFLKADVCQLGVDQRKVNMLAREYCDSAGIKLKPIILSHHMLYGLSKGQQKMSKSNKDSAIFMEDSASEVARKIGQAYCPRTEGVVEEVAAEESMSLTQDLLKNPCLDYVEHIVFASPDASFVAAGRTFESFATVRAAFVSEELTEAQLKGGLIDAVNQLLEPVRSHFATDPESKRLLELIAGWMAEPKAAAGAPTLHCLSVLPADLSANIVFAPPPSARPSLNDALDVLRCLEAVDRASAAGVSTTPVLWLADWSAFTLNRLSGGTTVADDLTAVRASYTVLAASLRALAPELMTRVLVLRQSDAILSDPSEYWVSVINAGRAHTLSSIRAIEPTNGEVGQVIATLMHVADVLALSAGAISPRTICSLESQRPLNDLAIAHLRVDAAVVAAGILPPTLLVLPHISLRLKAAEGGAAEAAMGANAPLDHDAEIFVLDAQQDVQRKMKKAFCEPGNVNFCPPLTLASYLVLKHATPPTLTVKRKPDDGGDLRYTQPAPLEADVASGALHPGDLKPSVRDAVDAMLDKVRQAIKMDPEAAKAEKKLVKVQKRKPKK